jgi:hypothetical protein
MSWDPVRVVRSRRSHCGATRSRCLHRVDFLHSGSLLGITGPGSALLGEVWRDPDRVEEIDDSGKEGGDEEVQEDPVSESVNSLGIQLLEDSHI